MMRALLPVLASMLAVGAAQAGPQEDCDRPNDPRRAIAGCTELLRQNDSNAVAYNKRGIAYAVIREFDHAIADYTRAIELDPNYADAFHQRGISHRETKAYERAI